MRVHPGDRIDGRYLVYEQTDDNWGVAGWRARDEVLGRDVLLTTFHPEDPRAEALVAAARQAATVQDHRFVRVLDAHIDQPVGFLVREWTGGQSLADLLGAGPLPEDAALAVGRDVAEALQHAHEAGQQHLCVDVRSVIIDDDGAVRLRGLGTAAVLRGVQPSRDGAARDDAEGVGRVLFAALTARSAGESSSPLPVVPHGEDSVPSPRQVRAGVSPALDAITVRALGAGRHARVEPYATPGEVAAALRDVPVDLGRLDRPPVMAATPRADSDPLDAVPLVPLPADRPALDPGSGPLPPKLPLQPHQSTAVEPPVRRGRLMRVALVLVAIVLGVGAFLFGLEVIEANRVPELAAEDSPTATTQTSTGPTASDTAEPTSGDAVVHDVVVSQDFDPLGNGSENGDRAALAVDGDLGTAWPTQTYFDPLELQKAGVGLLLDLGTAEPVSEVDLTLLGQSSDVEIRVAPEDATSPPDSPEGFIQIARSEDAGTALTVSGDRRVTRYVLVWFTRLPPASDGWRGGVAEAVVRG
jgi:putative peptidoglycan lipid II flippase